MILPLAVVLVAGLLILGLVIAERYPVDTWRDGLRRLRDAAREPVEEIEPVPQDARLEDVMEVGESSSYLGTDSFEGLVEVVERTMDAAESRTASLRRHRTSEPAA